jgi:subtilase family serine protease
MAGNQTGIRIQSASSGNTIGGSTATGNVISGNINDGIVITGTGTDNNAVNGNFIGVDASTGRNQLPNLNNGITISASAKSNLIGTGSSDGANVIAGNLGSGISITGTTTNNNKVMGNFIGVLANNSARGNAQSGIVFADSADTNTVGPGNVIAFNSRNGITVGTTRTATAVVRNKITRNSIFMNVGLGIDLGNDGVTPNDDGDADNGPNLLLNYPEITSVTSSGTSITVTGMVDTPNPNTTSVEIFTNSLPVPGGDPSGFGEGQTFAAAAIPNTMGAFTATFTSSANTVITALTIDTNGNTSEFSSVFQLGGGQPDLVVTGLTATPATINSGDRVNVTFNIKNQGTASASATRQDIVFSTDDTITAQDTVLASVNASTLAPQAMVSFTQSLVIPMNTASGRYFIGVISDAGTTVTESNETNNTASFAITVNSMPDLRVTNFKVTPTSAKPGDTVRIEYVVTNQGTDNAAAHTEEIRLSTDNMLSTTDSLLATQQVAGLKPGDTSRTSIDVRIPASTVPGSYFIGVIVDPRNAISESDETNNIASNPINLNGDIDLDLTNLTLTPNSGGTGTQVTVSFQLINRGSLPSPAVQLEVRFSNDNTITNTDALISSLTSSPLTPGQTLTLTATGTIPPNVTAGRSFIGIVADPQNLIAESNENNNTISSTFTVADQAAPIVNVKTPNGGETVTAGGTFTITWTATDDIAVTSQDIFLSTDGGANFNQVIVTGLVGSANTFLWNVPSNLSTGLARVQVVSRDTAGNLGKDASDNNFIIGQRPLILGPTFKDGKFTFLVSNSGITSGAMLTVINGASKENFAIGLNADGSKFVVTKKAISSPTGITLKQAIPPGVPVMLIVTNTNGIASLPITFQR